MMFITSDSSAIIRAALGGGISLWIRSRALRRLKRGGNADWQKRLRRWSEH